MRMAQAADQGLKIDWTTMPMYNTIMAVAVGAALVGIVSFGRQLLSRPADVSADGWALGFGVPGLILTLTGLHMTLTWPLAGGGVPHGNIIFGETSLGFGVLLLAAALYLWRRGSVALEGADPVRTFARVAGPISLFIGFLGLGLFGIAVAGIKYQLFAAPAEEPISGTFANQPLVEAIFLSSLIALVGVGAVLFPFLARALDGPTRTTAPAVVKVTGVVLLISGVAFGLFGAMNFFSHIGLIVNTM
jgi:uncharacterized membrane protein